MWRRNFPESAADSNWLAQSQIVRNGCEATVGLSNRKSQITTWLRSFPTVPLKQKQWGRNSRRQSVPVRCWLSKASWAVARPYSRKVSSPDWEAMHAVNSPTFTIVHEYQGGRLPVYHFDFFRLENLESAARLGLEDYFFGDGVSVIEWADRFPDLIPEHARWISFEMKSERQRIITLITIHENPGD